VTDEMPALARAEQAKAVMENVHWLKGQIEAIMLPPKAVDVMLRRHGRRRAQTSCSTPAASPARSPHGQLKHWSARHHYQKPHSAPNWPKARAAISPKDHRQSDTAEPVEPSRACIFGY
jgi:hypothetical protein